MKRILFACLFLPIACATSSSTSSRTPNAESTASNPKIFKAPVTKEIAPFLAHTEEKPMQAYLSMNLPYAPYQAMLAQLEKAEGVTLKSRGDAHITVVTPVEYDKVLKKHLSIAAIHKIAEEAKLQEIPWTPVCIGKAQKEIAGKKETTYFVVVESPELIDLRGKIEEAYIKNGGKAQTFVPERISAHITLGFTNRDLHAEDRVSKRRDSCIYNF